MNMQYQGLNAILNTAELVCIIGLATVFLYNRINILHQYISLNERLDKLIKNTSRSIDKRGKTKKVN